MGRFWGRFWGGFGEVLGRFLEGFYKVFGKFSGVKKPIKNKEKRIKTYKPYKKDFPFWGLRKPRWENGHDGTGQNRTDGQGVWERGEGPPSNKGAFVEGVAEPPQKTYDTNVTKK